MGPESIQTPVGATGSTPTCGSNPGQPAQSSLSPAAAARYVTGLEAACGGALPQDSSCCSPEDPMETARAIERERERSWGIRDIEPGHRSVGLIWGGILSNWLQRDVGPVPPEVVLLMLAGMKVARAANPAFVPDDYYDGLNYISFAYRVRRRRVKPS